MRMHFKNMLARDEKELKHENEKLNRFYTDDLSEKWKDMRYELTSNGNEIFDQNKLGKMVIITE